MLLMLHRRAAQLAALPARRERALRRTVRRAPRESLRIALINNMPDTALKDTESQFITLLQAASGDIPVRLEFFSLPQIPRSDWAQLYLRQYYADFNYLFSQPVDALIVTGTEPRQPTLQQEPYWSHLVGVLDWAATHTTSTILSCLAAHAGVLHSDGIERCPLHDKRFGVFEHHRAPVHFLLSHLPQVTRIPHSRWNDLSEQDLISRGYTILLRSPVAGVNMFVKKIRTSLMVHFQGHPEYAADTLFREYRRDVKRFLTHDREDYPLQPEGYFSRAALKVHGEFRAQAISDRRIELMESFPASGFTAGLEHSWRSPSIRIYRNWLDHLLRNRAETHPRKSVARLTGA